MVDYLGSLLGIMKLKFLVYQLVNLMKSFSSITTLSDIKQKNSASISRYAKYLNEKHAVYYIKQTWRK